MRELTWKEAMRANLVALIVGGIVIVPILFLGFSNGISWGVLLVAFMFGFFLFLHIQSFKKDHLKCVCQKIIPKYIKEQKIVVCPFCKEKIK